MAVKPIPERNSVTPYLTIKDAAKAIEFYKRVFGATETIRLAEPSGRIGHAEITIGGSPIMISDEYPEMGFLGPQPGGPRPPVMIHVYVNDVDTVYKRSLEAGAISLREPEDQFYGDRDAQIKDPFGHAWDLSTHKEDVSPEEMKRRFEAMMKQ
jgi:PhnB protein